MIKLVTVRTTDMNAAFLTKRPVPKDLNRATDMINIFDKQFEPRTLAYPVTR